MLGFVDDSHPALSELAENHIVPQHQRRPLAREDLVRLKRSQFPLLNQRASQCLTVLWLVVGRQA